MTDNDSELSKEEKKRLKKLTKQQRKDSEVSSEKRGSDQTESTDEERKRRKMEKKAKSLREQVATNSIAAKSTDSNSKSSVKIKSVDKKEIDDWCKQESVQAVSARENFEFLPILTFKQASFPPEIVELLSQFDKPTPIQASTWPILLKGHDAIGIAKTGSGKTLAFGIPATQHIKNQPKLSPPYFRVLVLAPTRELAMQIQETFETNKKYTNVRSVCIYGGVPKGDQVRALKQGVDIVVATPGRLLDLMNDGAVLLEKVSYLVLDEADRMLDLGFEQNVKDIVGAIKSSRQTVMFSATWPQSVQKLANEFLSTPAHVTIGNTDGTLTANEKIVQIVEVMEPEDKDRRLSELLEHVQHRKLKNRVLVFALYKKEAARLEEQLRRKGFNVAGIHGDLSQQARTAALAGFKEGKTPLLVATDVAARGLDIPNVEVVINYTFPLTVEDYVHRIGRTARGGADGKSWTFFTKHDKAHSGALWGVLKDSGQEVPEDLKKFGGTVKKKVDSTYGVFVKDIDMTAKPTKITFDSDSD
jgi:ATP-dependent RNA helicase DBP3